MYPKVTVICLCFNHEKFLEEALSSVFSQTYPNIQVIIGDDCSLDGSREKIRSIISGRDNVLFFCNEKNLGNCASFNKLFQYADGEFILDFSTDDILLPEAIEAHVKNFISHDERYGVSFSDALIINAEGTIVRKHSESLGKKERQEQVPKGDVYKDVVMRYFINPPSVMIRKNVLAELGGYDENLKYEDFDLWVRASRNYYFSYIHLPLVKKRIHKNNLAKQMNLFEFQETTFKVCLKAAWLNQTEEEDLALARRVRYEIGQAFLHGNLDLLVKYYEFLEYLTIPDFRSVILFQLRNFGIFLLPFYSLFKRITGKRLQ